MKSINLMSLVGIILATGCSVADSSFNSSRTMSTMKPLSLSSIECFPTESSLEVDSLTIKNVDGKYLAKVLEKDIRAPGVQFPVEYNFLVSDNITEEKIIFHFDSIASEVDDGSRELFLNITKTGESNKFIGNLRELALVEEGVFHRNLNVSCTAK